jgi:hypothetical protein
MVSVILQVVRSQIQQLGIIIALKYYCASCAKRLNNDIFNKPAALDMFGHDLCTVVK